MHIKIAQIKLRNPERLRMFRKNRRGGNVMREAEFERFILGLQKVHEAVNTISDLESAFGLFTTRSDKNEAKSFIAQMTEAAFVSSPWNDIAQSIIYYRDGGAIPGVSSEEKPEIPEAPSEEVAAPDEPLDEDSALIAEYEGLTPEQIRTVETYRAKKYPKGKSEQAGEWIRKNVADNISKLIEGYRIINSPTASKLDMNIAQESKIDLAIEFLDDYERDAIEEEAQLKRDEELKKLVQEEEDSSTKKIVIKEKENQIKKVYPSLLSEDEALAVTGIDLLEDYISIDHGILSVSFSKLNEAYRDAQNKMLEWSNSISVEAVGGKYHKISGEEKRAFNDIAYGIILFDMKLKGKFQEFIGEIDDEIEKSEQKEQIQKLTKLKNSLELQAGSKLKPRLITSRLSEDKDFSEKMAETILYAASFSAFRNLKMVLDDVESGSLSATITNSGAAKQKYIDTLESKTINGVQSRFRTFWLNASNLEHLSSAKSIFSSMNINSVNYQKSANKEATSLVSGYHSLNTTSCPVCNKVIEFRKGIKIGNSKEKYSGFEIGIFSPYIENDRKTKINFISEAQLSIDKDGVEKLFSPPGSDYIRLVSPRGPTLKIIRAMNSSPKTWNEITEMVNSSKYALQREGMLRRSEALRFVGAKFLKAININASRFLCPMGDLKSASDTNICGLKMNKPNEATRGYQLQPAWNGMRPDIDTSNNRIVKKYNNKRFKAEGWDDDKLVSIGESKAYGGYKYSKTLFGCPCRIENIDPDDQDMYLQHGDLAFRLSSSKDIQPPTSPDGSNAELEADTISFLVCGANVSLSSVDRDPNSDSYILGHLESLSVKDPNLFKELLDYLMQSGFDELELIQMIEDLSSHNQKVDSLSDSFMARRHGRISKLEDILIKAGAQQPRKLNPSILNIIKDMHLVCPFGHKFSIGKSLEFGRHHGAFRMNNKTKYKELKSIILSNGNENKKEFMKLFTPITAESVFSRKYMYYDDWINEDKKNRVINRFRLPSDKLSNLVTLKFDIDGQDYRIRDDIEVRRRQIWYSDSPRSADKSVIDRAVAQGTSDLSMTSVEGKREVDPGSAAQQEKVLIEREEENKALQDLKDWEIEMSHSLGISDKEGLAPTIPGGSSKFKTGNDLVKNMNSLSGAMINSLKIVNNWTEGVIHDNFARSLSKQFLFDDNLKIASDQIFDHSILSSIKIEESSEDFSEDFDKFKDSLRGFFGDIVKSNAEILSLIRKGELNQEQVATRIIKDSLSEFITKYYSVDAPTSIEPLIDVEDIDLLDPELLTISILNEEKKRNRDNFGTQTPELFEKITAFSSNAKTLKMANIEEASQIMGRITLVSYARFTANYIYKMENLFFNKTSPLYVGYELFDSDVKSIDDILNMPLEEIEQIKSQWRAKELVESEKTIYSSDDYVIYHGEKYMNMINMAYEYIDRNLKESLRLIKSPKSIREATRYVRDTLSDRFIAEYMDKNPKSDQEEAERSMRSKKARIDELMPFYSSNFKELISDNESRNYIADTGYEQTEHFYSPYSHIPFMKSKSAKKFKDGDFSNPFYQQLQVEEDPESGKMALTDSDRNYNSGRLQVGAMTTANNKATWPMSDEGFVFSKATGVSAGHVGFPIPFYHDYKEKSETRHLMIYSLAPVVKMPFTGPTGEENDDSSDSSSYIDIDIGFLIQRGGRKDNYMKVNDLCEELLTLNNVRDREKERINSIEEESPKEIERLEKEIEYKEHLKDSKWKRNEHKKKQLDRQISKLKGKIEALRGELLSVDDALERLNSWHDKRVSSINLEFSSTPMYINTKANYYHIKKPATAVDSGLVPGEFSKEQMSKLKSARAQPQPAVNLVDPVLAYKLIYNPEVHGGSYVNKAHPPEKYEQQEDLIKSALVDFIVGVYNLDDVAKNYAIKNKKQLKEIGYKPEFFSGKDLLVGTINKDFRDDLGFTKISFTTDMPGVWYDIDIDKSSISIESSTQDTENPDSRPTFMSILRSIDRYKKKGLGALWSETKKGDQIRKNKNKNMETVSSRAAIAMAKFVRAGAVRDTIDKRIGEGEDFVRDTLMIESSIYFQKNLKRAESLRRIIIMQDDSIIDPERILNLK